MATELERHVVQEALDRTGEAVYRNHVIRPTGPNGYTLTGHDYYDSLNLALRAIDETMGVKATPPVKPKDPLAPMTLNEAAYHLEYWFTELEENHLSILRLVAKEFAETREEIEEEIQLFRRAALTLSRLSHKCEGVIEFDKTKGCDITFKAKAPAPEEET